MIEIDCEPWRRAPAALPEGHSLFAIGDIHGHDIHLLALQDFLRQRILDACDPERTRVVWLGDYIDRGPASRAVLDLVAEGLNIPGLTEIRLKGNHEAFLIELLEDTDPSERLVMSWRLNGGMHTIESLLPEHRWRGPRDLAQALRRALGAARISFLDDLELRHRFGPYCCVHAGLNPSRDLEHQTAEDLLWIREPFLNPGIWTFDLVAIHGHTPQRPGVYGHRIAVDSGIYMSGQLTAVEIAGADLRFITASSPDARFFDWGYLD